jgi:hypothetical protein|tara:strand:- start:33 stop:446 length:414 start_codon:yes stop_codon:yes gene_type:complete
MMEEEFHGIIKLITGEEIFALISIDNNDGDPIIMLQSPVIIKMLSSGVGQYVKIKPWLELPEDDIFLIKYDKIITMTETKDKQMISFYERYLNDEDVDIEIAGKVTINESMGYVSTVDDARKKLEEIFKIPNNNKET